MPNIVDMGLWKGVDQRPDLSRTLVDLLEKRGLTGARATTRLNDREYRASWILILENEEPDALKGEPGARFRIWVTWHDKYLWTGRWYDLDPDDQRARFLEQEADGLAAFFLELDQRDQMERPE